MESGIYTQIKHKCKHSKNTENQRAKAGKDTTMTYEKSLLSIMQAEDRMVKELNAAISKEYFFLEECEHVSHSPYECAAKTADIERYLDIADKHHEEAEKCRQQLDTIRDELREYLRKLLA